GDVVEADARDVETPREQQRGRCAGRLDEVDVEALVLVEAVALGEPVGGEAGGNGCGRGDRQRREFAFARGGGPARARGRREGHGSGDDDGGGTSGVGGVTHLTLL